MISNATVGPMLIPLRQHLKQPKGRRWLRFNAFIIVNYWYNLALNLVKNLRFSVPGKYLPYIECMSYLKVYNFMKLSCF